MITQKSHRGLRHRPSRFTDLQIPVIVIEVKGGGSSPRQMMVGGTSLSAIQM